MKRLALGLPLVALLAACGGGGGAGPATITGSSVGTSLGGASAVANTATLPELLKVSVPTNYRTVGGHQQMVETYNPTRGELYTAEQSTVASGKVAISYDPRGAIFSLKIAQEGIALEPRFQDPAHRTAFGGARFPQEGVPNLTGFDYLELGTVFPTGFESQSMFYQTPGATTRYVALTGFVRNRLETDSGKTTITRTHGVSVFGQSTASDQVPRTGTGTFRGDIVASFVSNTDLDTNSSIRSRFEWIRGTGSLDLDFATGKIGTSMTGTVLGTLDQFDPINPASYGSPGTIGPQWGAMNSVHAGQTFTASGSATYDRNPQSFAGTITSATLGGQTIRIAGSSIDGALYGPTAQEAGYAFRVVGGIPDQRVDISGGFTGTRGN